MDRRFRYRNVYFTETLIQSQIISLEDAEIEQFIKGLDALKT